jgi:diphthine synthase
MLYLVGLGIWDEGDISLRGIRACRKADRVYAELYTSAWGGDLRKLERLIKKKIRPMGRSGLEERSGRLVRKARRRDVAVLVPGDPLSATTHSGLIEEARKEDVEVEVVHSSSVFTAVAETGLNIYNFGRTVTVVAPTGKYRPDSFYKTVLENRTRGMHSLLLLDIKMSVQQGLEVLMDIERRKRNGVLGPRVRIVVASSIGSSRKAIRYGTVTELAGEDFPPPAVIIIPGRLNFFEREFLERL